MARRTGCAAVHWHLDYVASVVAVPTLWLARLSALVAVPSLLLVPSVPCNADVARSERAADRTLPEHWAE
jgi:hypothetical protein